MQREQEMQLKNNNWQTDEVAEECKCDTEFPAFDKQTWNSETEVYVSTIGTQYKHSSSFNGEHGQSTLDE